MHPAKSVIFFTTATGAGYGLFIWLAVLGLMGRLPTSPTFALACMILALGLITAGLLSSTLHLGRPERAWRALSQWRSSWLSREGVLAILAFLPTSLFGMAWVFGLPDPVLLPVFAILGALLALGTVFTTSMIYASLKAVPAWNTRLTTVNYLILCLMSGAVVLLALGVLFDESLVKEIMTLPALILLVIGGVFKVLYWRHISSKDPVSTAESATGLGQFGKVALAGSPHSSDNYLLKEMGFQIARKHADKIRRIALILGFLMPAILLVAAPIIQLPFFQSFICITAAAIMFFGLIFERWLFFAEAKHVVTLYYGESQV